MSGVVIGLVVLGVLALALGLRGRRIGDEPRCRRCGFDLTGSACATEGAAPRGTPGQCPECGADVSTQRGVRIGERRRRPRVAALGAVLLLLAVGLGVYVGTSGNLNSRKPAWLLALDLRYGGDASAVAAATELTQRLGAGKLDADAVRGPVAAVLKRQRDPRAVWNTAYGDFVQAARGMGFVGEEDWADYLKNGLALGFEIRSMARTGEPLPLKFTIRSARFGAPNIAGAAGFTGYYLDVRPLTTEINGARHDAFRFMSFHQLSPGGSGSTQTTGPALSEVGEAVIRSTYRVRLVYSVDPFGSGRGIHAELPEDATVLREWTPEFVSTVRVVPPGTPLVTVVEDPAAGAAIASAIGIRNLRVVDADGLPEAPGPGGGAERRVGIGGELRVTSPPHGLAFDVFLRVPGALTPEGTPVDVRVHQLVMAAASGPQVTSMRFHAALPADVDPSGWDEVDFVFRSNPRLAERDSSIQSVWNGEFVLRGVKIVRPEPATEVPQPGEPAEMNGP